MEKEDGLMARWMKKLLLIIAVLAVIIFHDLIYEACIFLSFCTTHAPYRTQFSKDTPCLRPAGATGTTECEHHSWEQGGNEYDTLFVEFDDMGLLHPQDGPNVGKANQIENAMQTLVALSQQWGDLSLIVFVHGWKHNARAGDENVQLFHSILQYANLVEQARSKGRRVVGIYMGWRGLSATFKVKHVDLLANATFWTRKSAALHVAQGSARYLLARLRAFQRTQNCQANSKLCMPMVEQTAEESLELQRGAPGPKVRMLIIGHSFGGLIVFNAISEYFIESLTEEGQGSTEASHGAATPQRFGDMVVLLNPAFEATRYTPLQRVAASRDYDHYQAPLLVFITSTADWATRYAFKWARRVNSYFEHGASKEETRANINTPGHVEPYITHVLERSPEQQAGATPCRAWVEPKTVEDMRSNLKLETEAAEAFFAAQGTRNDSHQITLKPGWKRAFCDQTTLTHQEPHPPNVPIWNVRTDSSIIADHNDINGPLLTNFIRQLYHDSATVSAPE
jgi:hypothetical protein